MLDKQEALRALRTLPAKPDWAYVDAWAVDAIRGSLWELKGRETLTEYAAQNDITPLATRTIQRLSGAQEPPWPVIEQRHVNALIGLGTFGWKYDPAIIRRALDGGVRLFDTAEGYGYGAVEEALGPLIKGSGAIVATKVSRNHLAPKSILNAALRSAKRLGQIGLYQIHWHDPKYSWVSIMKVVGGLMQYGAVPRAGLCNVSVDMLWAAQAALLPYPISSVQVRYNLLDRGIERALLPFCKAHGIAVIAYSPLGQDFRRILAADQFGLLKRLARQYSATPAQVALAWIMGKGAIPIPRTNNPQHASEIADTATLVINGTQSGMLDAAFPIKE